MYSCDLIKLYRFQVHNSIKHHLHTTSCAHGPKQSLFLPPVPPRAPPSPFPLAITTLLSMSKCYIDMFLCVFFFFKSLHLLLSSALRSPVTAVSVFHQNKVKLPELLMGKSVPPAMGPMMTGIHHEEAGTKQTNTAQGGGCHDCAVMSSNPSQANGISSVLLTGWEVTNESNLGQPELAPIWADVATCGS